MALKLDDNDDDEEAERGLFTHSRSFEEGAPTSSDRKGKMNVSTVDASNLISITSDSFVAMENMSIVHESLTGNVMILFNCVNYVQSIQEAIFFTVFKDGVELSKTRRDIWHEGVNQHSTIALIATEEAEKNTWEIRWRGDDTITKVVLLRSFIVTDI